MYGFHHQYYQPFHNQQTHPQQFHSQQQFYQQQQPPQQNVTNQNSKNSSEENNKDQYIVDGKIIWANINKDLSFANYPLITKELLAKEFPVLVHFLNNVPLELYSVRELMKKVPTTPPPQSKKSLSQKIQDNNLKATELVTYEEQQDNRKNILHSIFFKHRPLISAEEIMNIRREQNIQIQPINSYDLAYIQLSGRISDETWEILHDLGSTKLRLRFFLIKDPLTSDNTTSTTITQDSSNQVSMTTSNKHGVFDTVEQAKIALDNLIECQQCVFTDNKTGVILNRFVTAKGDFNADIYKFLSTYSSRAQVSTYMFIALK